MVEYDLDAVPPQSLQVYSDESVSILSENDSPDVPFRFSVNPYRGCAHGCAYCYARPTHEYLGFGSGSDFERKIVAKQRASELLRAAFERRNWAPCLLLRRANDGCTFGHFHFQQAVETVVGRAAFILPAITPAKEVSHCFIVRTQSRCSRLSSVLAGNGLLGQPSKFAIGVVHKAIQEAARDLGTKIHRSRKRFD